MKKISLFTALCLLLFLNSNSFSQNSENSLMNTQLSFSNGVDKSLINSHFNSTSSLASFPKSLRVQPLVTVHLMGGYSYPRPDLKGSIPEWAPLGATLVDPDEGQPRVLRTKAGLSVQGDVHIAFGKTGPGKRRIRIVLGGGYTAWGHSQDNYRANNNFIYLGSDTTTVGKLQIHIQAVNVGLGAEFAFRPWETLNPFIGVDFTGHFYRGKIFLDPAPTSDSSYHELTMKSASRFGVSVGAGVDFAFSRNIGLIAGAKWNFHNILGKSAQDTAVGTNEFGLVDKEHTGVAPYETAGASYKSQNLSDILFYGGISIYFGQPTKKVVKK